MGTSDLLRRLAGTDDVARRALLELYEACAPDLFASLRVRRVGPADAADIVQEAFLKIWSSRTTLPADANPKAYAWCVTRNAWIDRFRSDRARAARTDAFASEGEAQPHAPPSDADGVDCLERAFEEFRAREPDRAHAIELVAVQGFDHHELADALGRTKGAAREFLSQSRRAFSRLYADRCGEVLA